METTIKTIEMKQGIPKYGTLKDFKSAVKLLKESGYLVTIVKSPSDLMRKSIITDNGAFVEAVVIAKYFNGWLFRYNKSYFSESKTAVNLTK